MVEVDAGNDLRYSRYPGSLPSVALETLFKLIRHLIFLTSLKYYHTLIYLGIIKMLYPVINIDITPIDNMYINIKKQPATY